MSATEVQADGKAKARAMAAAMARVTGQDPPNFDEGDDPFPAGVLSVRTWALGAASDEAAAQDASVKTTPPKNDAPVPPAATAETMLPLCRLQHFPEPDPTPLPPLCSEGSHSASHAPPLVSIISPTSKDRAWTHESLYACFAHQTYPNLELLVLDTGSSPSPFFLECTDPRVRYFYVPFHAGLSVDETLSALQQLTAFALTPPSRVAAHESHDAWSAAWKPTTDALAALSAEYAQFKLNGVLTHLRADEKPPGACISAVFRAFRGRDLVGGAAGAKSSFSLGAKRNWLAAQAGGEYHVNFDDDDVYLPSYVERMVAALRACDAELVKLACFIEYDCDGDKLRRFGSSSADAKELLPELKGIDLYLATNPKMSASHGNRWGYGFSYVHTARLAFVVPYPPIDFGEDYQKLLNAGRLDPRAEWSAGRGRLKPSVAFADSVGDAVVVHIKHGTNTSSVVNVTPLLSPPFDDKTFDAFFAEPCRHLLRPAMAHSQTLADARHAYAMQTDPRLADPALASAIEANPHLLNQPFEVVEVLTNAINANKAAAAEGTLPNANEGEPADSTLEHRMQHIGLTSSQRSPVMPKDPFTKMGINHAMSSRFF